MQFSGIGPLYQFSWWLQKNRAILINLCKIICAQVHFHENFDIKPRIDSTNGQNVMKHFQYSFATWYHPKKGCIVSRRFILNILHVTQNRPRVWVSMTHNLWLTTQHTGLPYSMQLSNLSICSGKIAFWDDRLVDNDVQLCCAFLGLVCLVAGSGGHPST